VLASPGRVLLLLSVKEAVLLALLDRIVAEAQAMAAELMLRPTGLCSVAGSSQRMAPGYCASFEAYPERGVALAAVQVKATTRK